jgi:peroxiredoxin
VDPPAADDLPVTAESLQSDFELLRKWAGNGDLESPLLARLSSVAARYEMPVDWRLPVAEAEDVGERPELDSLGPAHWTPVPAPPLVVWNATGEEARPLESTGKAKLVMFYLGFGCLHCMEQLQKFSPRSEDFAAAGVELVAVSSESVELLQQGLQNFDQSLTFPLHADRELAAFRAFRCYDDFESQPLHGTFLLGSDGRVLWQDIGHEPFMDVDFLLGEVPRLLQVWAP